VIIACEEQVDCRRETQAIRLIDIFLLGPAMVLVGLRHKSLIGMFVAGSGVACSVWNAYRFLQANARRTEQKRLGVETEKKKNKPGRAILEN